MSNSGEAIPTEKVVKAYLKSLKATTWPPKTYKISKDGVELDNAVAWTIKVSDAVNAIRNMAMGSSRTLDEVAEEYRRMEEGETYGIR